MQTFLAWHGGVVMRQLDGLVINRSQVRLAAVSVSESCNDSARIVRTRACVSTSNIIWYWSKSGDVQWLAGEVWRGRGVVPFIG